ncbi:hypothetical protein B0H14DRAFT_2610991 [Mycena olivaceomarginata]|nr:hypothetical protein B0H14DRAFT_2610991 [Mycena olivaceomarginata]
MRSSRVPSFVGISSAKGQALSGVDIWKGTFSEKPVCLKVLRFFATETDREKLKKEFFHEALIWRQLRHPNILPFLGISDELFAPSLCMISPWMENGSLIRFLENNPLHDRFESYIEPLTKHNVHHFLTSLFGFATAAVRLWPAETGHFPHFLLPPDAGINTDSFQSTVCKVWIHNG